MTPADIILMQLGGWRRLNAMIGAKDFTSKDDGRTLMFRHMRAKSGTFIEITLNVLDLYDVKFIKVGRMNSETFERKVTTTSEASNVYADQLRSVIEKATGLYLSLNLSLSRGN